MPMTNRIGVETAANRAIGGIPTLHYLDLLSRGRGEVVRLLFIDAGIAFDDARYPEQEFALHKHGFITQMNPTGTVPIVELNGGTFTQSYAILRHFARLLEDYDGNSVYEKYWVDAMCDIAIDWRTRFVDALLSPNMEVDLAKYRQTKRDTYIEAIEKHLVSSQFSDSGPFVLGNKITYADLVVYQVCHDEDLTKNRREGLTHYPRVRDLVDAVEDRERIREFMESTEYRG